MNIEPSDIRVERHRWLTRVTTILIGMIALIVFYPLTACDSQGSKLNIKTTATAISNMEPTAAATAPSQDSKSPWKLVWHDEFDGPVGAPADPSKWTPAVGGGGWGNKQLEYDTDNQNAYLDGQSNLVLEARRNDDEDLHCWYGPCQYTSAHISTKGHFSFTFGFLEARIKVPYGQGIWSAFWLIGNNCDIVGWPACGEVDIMENISNEPTKVQGTVHGPGYFTGNYGLPNGSLFTNDFHNFAVQWDPSHLYFFVDGVNYATLDKENLTNQQDWVYNHPFDIVLNLPVGGTWTGSPDSTTTFPQKMYISYVRLYKHK